jgi:hypothetical protein
MGIRFFCPNGHKLHVKSLLAGLKGYCPQCGAELIIPLTSTRRSSREGGGLINTDSESEPQNSTNQNTQLNSNTTPNNNLISQNPILQDPNIEWYIFNPENEKQQGPLTNQIMKKLIQQHQIKPLFLIWHDGMQEWTTASTIFPELGNP